MRSDSLNFQKNCEKSAEFGVALQKLLKLVGQETDLPGLLGDALDILLEVSWLAILPKAGVFLADEARGELRLTAQRALHPEIRKSCASIKFGQCLCGRAALLAQTQHAACVDKRHEIRFDGMTPHGHYNVPIKAGRELLGVLVVYLPEHHGRDPEEVEFLESFADALAMLIQSRAREAALIETQSQLREALCDARSLTEVINQNLIVSHATPAGHIFELNDALCEISGYARADLIGRSHNVLNSGEHSDAFWEEFWATISSGEAWRGEICNRRKDGTLYWVDSIVFPVKSASGEIQRYTSIRIDVTERKRAEGTLSHLGRILDGSSNEIYVADADSLLLTSANHGARENLGYPLEELLRLTAYDINPTMTPERMNEMAAPLRRGEKSKVTLQSRHRRKDGSEYPVEITLHLARDETPPVFVAIVNDITERQVTERRIKELAYFDPLTGLPNRALLMDRLSQALARAERNAAPLKLLFLDLNRFKEINDTRGHAVGDVVLREVAARFRAQLRGSETLARLGGDEFVAIIENADDEAAKRVIERLCLALKTPITVNDNAHSLSVSVGVASFPEDGGSADTLLSRSDIAMYEAKTKGRTHCCYNSKMGQRLEKRLETARLLASAVENNGLQLHFQPFIDLASGDLLGAEALLRWRDPQLGQIPPGEFIPIAQERRMMGAIGAWVIEEACRQLREWDRQDLHFPGRLAVNIDAQQISDDDLPGRLARSLARHEIDASRLEIEITESCMMEDRARSVEIVRQIKNLGVAVAVDDFGTGYSSLAYLKEFEIDKLKIDMSFVQDLSEDPNSRAIVAATIAMAGGLGVSVLAEGVETIQQSQLLQFLGCRQGQGFHFGKPIAAQDFAETWLCAEALPA